MHPQEQGAFTSVFAACTPRDNPQISRKLYICGRCHAGVEEIVTVKETLTGEAM
jgi:hypothetical protein